MSFSKNGNNLSLKHKLTPSSLTEFQEDLVKWVIRSTKYIFIEVMKIFENQQGYMTFSVHVFIAYTPQVKTLLKKDAISE